jgi:periplasmic divalent cation tolerance protein
VADPQPLALVRTTVATKAQAEALARILVVGGLAACVHVHPIRSTYRWKGRLEQTPEVVVEARTTVEREGEVREAMARGHPYEVPLVESWRVQAGASYAAWARQAVAGLRQG